MFILKEELINHLKIHAGSRSVKGTMDKKFMCTQCDKKFFTRKDLKRHSVVHTGNREFCCPHCSQRFGRKVRMLYSDESNQADHNLITGSYDKTRKEDTPQLLSGGCLSWGKG